MLNFTNLRYSLSRDVRMDRNGESLSNFFCESACWCRRKAEMKKWRTNSFANITVHVGLYGDDGNKLEVISNASVWEGRLKMRRDPSQMWHISRKHIWWTPGRETTMAARKQTLWILKQFQSFAEFVFILLNTLKPVKHTRFYKFQIFIMPPLTLCSSGRPHNSDPAATPLLLSTLFSNTLKGHFGKGKKKVRQSSL